MSKFTNVLKTVGNAVVHTDLADVGSVVASGAKATTRPAKAVGTKVHDLRVSRAMAVLDKDFGSKVEAVK